MYSNCGTMETPKIAPAEMPAIMARIDETVGNLKEANNMLTEMHSSLFGKPEEKRVDIPQPPLECMYDYVMFNLEQSHAIMNQLVEIRRRLLG